MAAGTLTRARTVMQTATSCNCRLALAGSVEMAPFGLTMGLAFVAMHGVGESLILDRGQLWKRRGYLQSWAQTSPELPLRSESQITTKTTQESRSCAQNNNGKLRAPSKPARDSRAFQAKALQLAARRPKVRKEGQTCPTRKAERPGREL